MTYSDFVDLCIERLGANINPDIIPNSIWTMVDVLDREPNTIFMIIDECKDDFGNNAWRIKWLKTGEVDALTEYTIQNYSLPIQSDLIERIGEIQ